MIVIIKLALSYKHIALVAYLCTFIIEIQKDQLIMEINKEFSHNVVKLINLWMISDRAKVCTVLLDSLS